MDYSINPRIYLAILMKLGIPAKVIFFILLFL